MNGTRRFFEKTARWLCLPAIVIWAVAAGPAASDAAGSELWIGAATADITPDQPVPLTGYRSVRVSQSILSRCTANVLALEAREGDKVVDQAILVACDLCVIRPGIQEGFREHVEGRLPGFDVGKLFLASTRTHSAPVLLQGRYQGYGDAMQPKDYVPTPKALAGGGYSAIVEQSLVGPEGGQALVERTVATIGELWK